MLAFFICGLIQIVFAILLVTKGIDSVQQTTETIEASAESMRLYFKEAADVALNLKQVGDTGSILEDQLVFDLARFLQHL